MARLPERGSWIVYPVHICATVVIIAAAVLLWAPARPAIAEQATGMSAGAEQPAEQVPPTDNTSPGEQAAPAAESPSQIVDDLHQKLVEAMQGGKQLGYKGRYTILDPVIASHFDTPLIVKVILSRYWDEISDGQKKNFIEVFHRLSVATYASRFDEYNGEKFIEVSREQLKKGRVLIKTELQRPNDKPVKLDYLMQEDNGRWLIISVIADGVNDLSLKRAEYAAVIKDKGYDGLVKDIEQKIKNMETDQST